MDEVRIFLLRWALSHYEAVLNCPTKQKAHGVGEGRYRQIFGNKDSSKVFLEHLHRVVDICGQHGLHPMIWSDMLFCLGRKDWLSCMQG
jgi:hypothetical protein